MTCDHFSASVGSGVGGDRGVWAAGSQLCGTPLPGEAVLLPVHLGPGPQVARRPGCSAAPGCLSGTLTSPKTKHVPVGCLRAGLGKRQVDTFSCVFNLYSIL